jgi:hypothetical protein
MLNSILLTRSAAPSPVFKDGVRRRGSGSTLSKPWPSGGGVEGLTFGPIRIVEPSNLWINVALEFPLSNFTFNLLSEPFKQCKTRPDFQIIKNALEINKVNTVFCENR